MSFVLWFPFTDKSSVRSLCVCSGHCIKLLLNIGCFHIRGIVLQLMN